VQCAVTGQLALDDELTSELEEGDGGGSAQVLAAYERLGDHLLARLRGQFALALWDERRGQGLLAVDQLGAGGLFLAEAEGALHFCSELRGLLRRLPRRPGPERTAVVHWLTNGLLERGQTLYEGVRRLPGGHVVRLDGDGWREVAYWTPRYAGTSPLHRSEAAGLVGAALRQAVDTRTPRGARVGVLLSGGLDSPAVTVAVQEAVSGKGGTLTSYSALFPAHSTVDESALIADVTAELALESRRFAVGGGSMLAGGLDYLQAWGLPSVSPNLYFQTALLEQASHDAVACLFDGQGGDELFGCADYLPADLIRHGKLRSAWGLSSRYPGLGESPLPRRVRRLFAEFGLKGSAPHAAHALVRRARRPSHYAPAWLTPQAAALQHSTCDPWAWKRLEGPLWWAQLSDRLTVQRERMGAHDFLRHKNRHFGLAGAHPLLDDVDLIELVLTLPPDIAFDPDLDRPLLRDCMVGKLPDSVRLRPRKSTFDELFVRTLDTTDRVHLTRLLTAPDAEVRSYVRVDVAQERLLDAPRERRGGSWAWALWRLAIIECWLQAQGDPGFARRALDTWGMEPLHVAQG
jgi:asparagine synthase (glutamine-hydrolysing)